MFCVRRGIASIALVLAGGASAAAATLNVTGPVSVNSGSGFRPVTSGVEVNPGDRVLVGNGGSAQIVYNSTCTANVLAGAIATVSAQAPCTVASQPAATNGIILGAVAVAGGAGLAVALSGGAGGSGSPSVTPAPTRPASP